MEKLLANDLLKIILVLGGGAVAMLMVMTRLVSRVKGTFRPYQKATVIYVLVFLLFFTVIALAPYFFESTQASFIVLQSYFLLLGTAHMYFLSRNIGWVEEKKTFRPELLFTLLIGCLGTIAFLLLYKYIDERGRHFLLLPACIFFIIPFFIYHAFERAMEIPPKILQQWFYPVGEEIDEPEDSKMKNMVVISFEFPKHSGDKTMTNFRAKAPKDMEVGQLFYYFINDYNLMHPTSRIQYSNGNGEPFGWIFYKKPKWHTITTKYIDAGRTINTNSIQENDVIICNRIHT